MKIGKMVLKGCIPVLAVVAIFVVVSAKSSSQETPSAMPAPDVIIGEYCFNFVGFLDTWHLQFDDKGNGFYDITGFDEYFDSVAIYSAISGGAHRVGKHLYGTFSIGLPNYNAHGAVVFDLNVKTMTGVAELTWTDVTGGPLPFYSDWPIAMVPCTMGERAPSGTPSLVR